MDSLMVPPSASPARSFLRRSGGRCTNLSWYSHGQGTDKKYHTHPHYISLRYPKAITPKCIVTYPNKVRLYSADKKYCSPD